MKKIYILLAAVIIAAITLPGCGPLTDNHFELGYGFAVSFSILGEEIENITVWEDGSTVEVNLENNEDNIILEVSEELQLKRAIEVPLGKINNEAECTLDNSNNTYLCIGEYVFSAQFSQPESIRNSGAMEVFDSHYEETTIRAELQKLPDLNMRMFEYKADGVVHSADQTQSAYWKWEIGEPLLVVWFDAGIPTYYLFAEVGSCYDEWAFHVTYNKDGSVSLYTAWCPPFEETPLPIPPVGPST